MKILILALSLPLLLASGPLMIEEKNELLQTINKTNLAVFFYGDVETEEYQAYEAMIPGDRQLFQGLEFYHIPASKFKMTRANPSLSVYRMINRGEWLTYRGIFDAKLMGKWLRKNCFDQLPDISGERIDQMLVEGKKGFILLDFGQFNLLRTKIQVHEFCEDRKLLCGKCTIDNPALNMVIQLMRAEQEPGVPKLGYWDPQSQKFQIYTKDLSEITKSEILAMYEGREGIVSTAPEVELDNDNDFQVIDDDL